MRPTCMRFSGLRGGIKCADSLVAGYNSGGPGPRHRSRRSMACRRAQERDTGQRTNRGPVNDRSGWLATGILTGFQEFLRP